MRKRANLKRLLFGVAMLLFVGYGSSAISQTRPVIGLHENTPNVLALTHAKIVVAPGRVLEDATLVVRNGHIEAVGQRVAIPPDAVVKDMRGKTIYPGFIDLYTHYGVGKAEAPKGRQQASQRTTAATSQTRDTEGGARYWNATIRPERNVADRFKPDKKAAKAFRKVGITTVLTLPREGLLRGEAALVLMADKDPNAVIIEEQVAQAMSFTKGRSYRGRGVQGYPGSLMGAIALLRQAFLDADWYRQAWQAFNAAPAGKEPPETNLSLEALQPYAAGRKPIIMEVRDELDIFRAVKIANEFGLNMWVRGSGSEYRRLQAIKKTGVKLIIPVDFPKAPDVSTPEREADVSLRELRHWDFAPENPGRLAQAGIRFSLTTSRLKNPGEFLNQLRRAVKRGLSREAALAALTTTPAAWLKKSKVLGTLERGKLANFIVTDGDIFQDKTRILDTYVAGERYEITPTPEVEVRGEWTLTLTTDGKTVQGRLTLSGEALKPRASLKAEGKKIKAKKVVLEGRRLAISFPGDSLGFAGVARLSGLVENRTAQGAGVWGDGRRFTWTAQLEKPHEARADTAKPAPVQMAEFPVVYPDGAFGRPAPPEQPEYVLVKDATIWTVGPQGTLEGADMLVKRGKIVKIGKGLSAPAGAVVIDATGKHVTPGIIDGHSHIAISRGVNEGTHAISSEVRIGDVINSDDINIYRQLAGGVTMANLLHGSANPIGGQNAVIKLRWGALPEEMKFDGAKPGIKFALGENVKQSNWGDRFTTRYPQTRMGVEQFFRDYFHAALDYRREWQEYEKKRKKNKNLPPPRKNLRLEALLEILDGKRQIHCHSYRQDEILALMRVAEDIGFKVDVFTHILEGYKVADVMFKHGAMASTFSDWWAYKFEVYDAIPYNGALMYEQGVIVGYNSDSAELARRLNTEAAKAIKYGNVPPEEAIKFVTLNPAKQLRVDHRVGSLEPGKDADFVIWSGPPMSTYSVCEQTWIDGRKYFDIEEDKKLREEVAKQRARLVQKILASDTAGKRKGAGKKPSAGRPYTCEDGYDWIAQ